MSVHPPSGSELWNLPFWSPERPAPKFRPIQAYHHAVKLTEDKEDTAQVFYMSDCLPCKRSLRKAQAFCESNIARELMEKEAYLPPLLDDHDSLLRHGPGSVAHAYVSFMRREQLSAAGLVEASTVPGRPIYADKYQWFLDRLRDTHDLAHILTGYGRDALGEQCVLGFTDGQHHDRTDWVIAWLGTIDFATRVKSDAPVIRAVAQAARSGKAAQAIFKQRVTTLLAEPLEAARLRLGIAEPTRYIEAHARLRARGMDPYKLMASEMAA